MCMPDDFISLERFYVFGLSDITLFKVSLGLLGINFYTLVYAD